LSKQSRINSICSWDWLVHWEEGTNSFIKTGVERERREGERERRERRESREGEERREGEKREREREREERNRRERGRREIEEVSKKNGRWRRDTWQCHLRRRADNQLFLLI
jgi:hypothetical protein